ncbi:hypothetical protein [Streptomyces sp. NPDC051554]|uniref:hypothetical protein n=1 Tax=Streptomyces sp. NPDC051554 TaxID=3365656 RepID=UPI0037AD15C7
MSESFDLESEIVDRVLKIPDDFRDFSVPKAVVKRIFGLDEALRSRLLDLGLPHRGTAHDTRFDPLDLENIGTFLRLPALHWSAMRLWSRSLAKPRSRQQHPACQVKLRWKCPAPGHSGECRFSISPEFNRALGIASLDGKKSMTLDAVIENRSHDFGLSLDPVIREAGTLIYHRLPPQLIDDTGFLSEHRLADCRSATGHLVQIANRSGLNSRPAWGLFMAGPYPIIHAWPEIEQAGAWVPADPFFLATLQQWDVLSGTDWPLSHAPQGVLWRLGVRGGRNFHIVYHGQGGASISLIARWQE